MFGWNYIGNSQGLWGLGVGWGAQEPKFLKESTKLNWDFAEGWGDFNQNAFHGAEGYKYFL